MTLPPSQINRIIQQRLDQQARDWNVAHGTNLSVEQYVNSLTGVTAGAKRSLLEKYNAALPTVPSVPSVPSVPGVQSLATTQTDLWESKYFTAEGKETTPEKAVIGPVETAKLLGKEPPPGAVPAGTLTPRTTKAKIVEGSPIETIKPTGITLRLSDAERQKLATKQQQTTCQADAQKYEVKLYKVGVGGGESIFVEEINKTQAKERAEGAGYKVTRVTWSPSYTETESRGTTSREPAPSISIYTVKFERGSPIEVEATSEAQAIAIAQNRQGRIWGLALSATKGKVVNISSDEAAKRIIKAYDKGSRNGVEALCIYGGLLTNSRIKVMFGEVVPMPEAGSVPINTHEGIMLITGDYANLLRDTQYYKDSKGAGDANRLGDAHISIQQDYERWSKAIPILTEAGLTNDDDFTITNLARFARNNPNGIDVLKDAGFSDEAIKAVREFNKTATKVSSHIADGLKDKTKDKTLTTGEKQALARIYEGIGQGLSIENLYKAGAFDKKAYDMLKDRFGKQWVEAYPTTLEAGIQPEFLKAVWDNLDDDTKVTVAFAFDRDYSKGSSFASVIKGMEHESMKGPWQLVTLAIPVSILSPVGKQITLEEATKTLNKQYGAELEQFVDYVKKDGGVPSFDLDKIQARLNSDNKFTANTLKETGYDSKKQLLDNLEYYNYATRVSPKEWAIAGLVGGLTVLSLGGGTLLGSVGAGGKVAASFLGNAMPVTLGALILPDTVRVVKDPKAPIWLKVLATGGTALMFAPLLGPTIRGVQFIKTAARGDYVPLRSMSIEASTARVPFTDAQIAKMTAAGLKTADIIDLGTKVLKQLLAGKKVAIVKVPGTGITIKVKSVTYQQLAGPALFNSTPDGTLLARGASSQPIFRSFFTEGKVAIEPLQRSYLTGQRATKPTINEIRIADPELVGRLFPQQRIIGGGRKGRIAIEPEAAIPSLDELQGMGYRLQPIPGPAGRGVTFDATLGRVNIQRYTLAKVVESPTGLIQVKLGGTGDGGVVAIGDLHGTAKYTTVFDGINSGYAEPLIKGDPKNPGTWTWGAAKGKGRTVVFMGDLIDRGPAYDTLRQTFNRLADQARSNGGQVVRLLGNHELAYLSGDVIKGGGPRGFPDIIPDKVRAQIKANIVSDINNGYVVAAFAKDGKLFTHAGVSKGVFPEFKPSVLERSYNALRQAGRVMREVCAT